MIMAMDNGHALTTCRCQSRQMLAGNPRPLQPDLSVNLFALTRERIVSELPQYAAPTAHPPIVKTSCRYPIAAAPHMERVTQLADSLQVLRHIVKDCG
jgi:hypothetical protein